MGERAGAVLPEQVLMRLSIEHRTTYRFSTPQARLVQMLRVTPANSHDQTVASWRLDIDCDARLREGRDGFGNRVTMLYVDGPVDQIEIAVVGEVVTSHSGGVLHGVSEALPPALFLRSTPPPLATRMSRRSLARRTATVRCWAGCTRSTRRCTSGSRSTCRGPSRGSMPAGRSRARWRRRVILRTSSRWPPARSARRPATSRATASPIS